MGGGHCFDIKKTVAEPLQGSRKELGGVGGGHCFDIKKTVAEPLQGSRKELGGGRGGGGGSLF